MDLGDITGPEMGYDGEPEPADGKSEEAEKSVDVKVRAV